MSLPDAAAPLAILVLAWDETTPAARVLVEPADFAAPALDSVVVLIPTDPPGDTLTQEEFLPLPTSPALALPAPSLPNEAPTSPDPTETSGPEAETAEPIKAEPTKTEEAAASQQNIRTSKEAVALEATGAVATDPLPKATLPASADTNTPLLPAAAAALVGPALVWQEVRVLHFSSPTQPILVWKGAADTPAAPYLGSSVAAAATTDTSEAQSAAVAATLLAGAGSAASALRVLRGPEMPGSGPAPTPVAGLGATPPPAYLLAELPAAPDAESDATPAPGTDEQVLTPNASTTELSEATGPAAGLTVDASAVQTGPTQPTTPAGAAMPPPPAAENSLLPAAELAAPTASSLDALHPAGQSFDAPDLNFQIIQYARQAVPQALAEQPFGVIYAPAWPTWLAAQELRHRSGQPLVLHLAQLAAADDELIDLAAGWVAEIQRQALHRADLILTETPALAQRLRHELALPAYRVRAVPAADAAAVAQALGGVVRR
jgi:hypothetical protein